MSNEKKKPQNEEIVEEIQSGIEGGLVDVDLSQEVRSAFLDYSMSVIVSRAIPDVRDGLKPVHRRIIYGMNELGMYPDKPYKKSARIVGDVMGKYHPHGDQAIYSTLVRMAQDFSLRYPLVDGHGNFGSVDGDEAAAMRYTEARMAKMASEMVKDINSDTVNFVENYDGSEKEPTVLPARFPNLLVNGSSGIAVGMATNMPPHNLREVANALKAVARNPEITVLELMNDYIEGPDFPTGGYILGKGGIRQAFETGTGSITIRAKAEVIDKDSGRKQIIISEIPYQVNKATLIETIARLIKKDRKDKDKFIEGITDIRDLSNKEGMRIVIDLRRDVIPEVILNQLYKYTQLQANFGIINLALVNGQPKVLSLKEMLNHYLDHQIAVVERRTRFLLAKAEDRVHIVDGYLIAISNIDEVIAMIRQSQTVDIARQQLAEKFSLSDKQTREIVDMPLRRLTGMEHGKLQEEKEDLETKIKYYQQILEDRHLVIETILTELEELVDKFGDERKTEISSDLSSIEDEDLIPQKDIVVTLTSYGYIKRMDPDVFRLQNRGGRGVKGMVTNDQDFVSLILHTNTHIDLLFFTNFGKVYRKRGYQIPEYARTAKGIPIVNMFNLDKEERVLTIISVDEYRDNHFLIFVTKEGIIKRTAISEFSSIRQNGKIAITLRETDQLLDVKHTNGDALIGIASSEGKMVKFHETEARDMGRGAMGVKGMSLSTKAEIIGVTTSEEGEYILVVTEKGFGKMSHAETYRQTRRGAKGVMTIKVAERIGNIVAMRAVKGNEDLLMITNEGIVIRIPVSQIKIAGRQTQGVRLMNPDETQKVVSISVVEHVEEEVEESETPTVVEIKQETE